ncbi:aldolase/citrate lyase family protein [Arthrobacter sp. zg-Y859]|uniref:Aldolase/citrate lyase family protein n=1 Tax=Arthrobacter jinronghuae TaxID=2964609 RepID=A0ABT1NMF5_9MICC|nr:aldolase/citrate lyase family protein [Arthrobacter jinronghuae]MCQ1948886.1 aldolase/citrate lyase family protein [Arthrobacter jinronghuae]UWX78309.1 aldolase/citrate lyase family protein [Arthrobacter jinronghuae]
MSLGQSAAPVLLHIATPSMAAAENALDAGYDGVMLDLQHGEIGLDQASNMLRSIPRGNAYLFARVACIDSGVIGRLLDSGARGIVAPTVESAEQAQALVSATKYPPLGRRSLGPSRPALYSGADYCAAGNQAVSTVVQIETAAGVEAADRILSVDGVDSLYIGPSDLAVSYGLPGRPDWSDGPVADAVAHLAERARVHGVKVGLYCSDPAFAAGQILQTGLDYVGLGIDLMFISKQARASLAALKEAS